MGKNIFYILLLLFWVAYKFYKNSENKNTKTSTPTPDSTDDSKNKGIQSFFEEMMDESFVPSENKSTPQVETLTISAKNFKKSETFEKSKPSVSSQMPGDSSKQSVNQTALVYKNEHDTYFDYTSSINLRQAIVLSEIINNPFIQH